MASLPAVDDPALLVGSDTLDDAAVYRLNDDIALVQTVDFFTPVVDDPYDFGRIAAANAFSDVYAMGARPLTALNIVAFPSGVLPLDYLSRILQGGAETARLASATIVGGHTIDDPEPKYGLAVTGIIKPGEETDQRRRRSRATSWCSPSRWAPGSSPPPSSWAGPRARRHLGGHGLHGHPQPGRGGSGPRTWRAGADRCHRFRSAGTSERDVPGERGGRRSLVRSAALLPGADELARAGVAPGGTKRNLEFVEPWTGFDRVSRALADDSCAPTRRPREALCSACRRTEWRPWCTTLEARGTPAAAVIGQVRGPGDVMMRVLASPEGTV